MISAGNAGNAACVRGIKIAFPPSSLIIVPTNSKWQCENLTARASRISRTWSVVGRFVQIAQLWRLGCDTSSVHFIERAARDA